MKNTTMRADIHIRTTRAQKRQLALLAADADQDLSTYLRGMIDDAVDSAIAAGKAA